MSHLGTRAVALLATLLATACGGSEAPSQQEDAATPLPEPRIECAQAKGLDGALDLAVLLFNPAGERELGVRVFHRPCLQDTVFLAHLGPYLAPAESEVWVEESVAAEATPTCPGDVTLAVLIRRPHAPDTWQSTNTLTPALDDCRP